MSGWIGSRWSGRPACHFIGVPRVGDIDEEFDRWFLHAGAGRCGQCVDLPDEEIELAGNGAYEIRS